MDSFSTAELGAMQTSAAESMMNTCKVGVWSTTGQDAAGQPVEVWTYGSAITCGLNPKGGREVNSGAGAVAGAEPILTDATVRLPIATSVDRRDRIKVTHRFGAAITEQVFEIVQEPRRGPSGLQLDLRKAAL